MGTDPDGAKAFYSALLGWEADDIPVGEDMVYSMMKLGGKDVAAISAQPQAQREAGVPPVWNSYVSVESADAAAEKAGQLGATVHAPPFDVFDSGRMAVIQDPQGAFFEVWQPNQHFGAQLVNQPGALCWNELASPDLDASRDFYGQLFGWAFDSFGDGEQAYFVIRNGDHGNGGVRDLEPTGAPPYWGVYFAVDELDSAYGKVAELGGRQVMPPAPIADIARFAVVSDPQGAMFCLYDGQLDD